MIPQGERDLRWGARGRFLSVLAFVAGLALLAANAGASEEPQAEESPSEAAADPDPGDWQFSLAAYGWITDITGTVTAGDVRVDLEPQLWNDILRNLNGALMGGAEAVYRDRWLVNLDLFGSLLGMESERGPYTVGFGPRTLTRELRSANLVLPVETRIGTLEVPVRVDPGTLRVDIPRVETAIGPFDVDVSSLMIMSRAQIGYRAVDVPALELLGREPGDDPRRFRVDLFAGLRYWYLRTEVDIESPPVEVPEFTVTSSLSGGRVRVGGQRVSPRSVAIPRVHLPGLEFGGATFGGTDVDETSSAWWIDPLVGMRVSAGLTERIGIAVAGNVGGFDIGSASKFSWEALAFLDWRFGETTSFVLGYRAVGLDRQKGEARADVILHGPLLGLLFRY
jgi:hypothetical protein